MAAINAQNLFLLMELLESSDSSDDDIEQILTVIKPRNKKPKIQSYISDVVSHYSDMEFRKNFRLQRQTCAKLVADFETSIHCPTDHSHGGSKPISAETHILSFLWFAGNKSCIRDVSSRFGIGESTFHEIIHRVMNFLLDISSDIIKFPKSQEDKEKLAADFSKISGFPNVLGCIDGTYIPIRTPAHKIKSTYINRHDGTSITMQGICDAKRRFMDVFTGTPSKIHDSRIMKMSFIYQQIQQICGHVWHILGDGAYPIQEWLMTPYRDYGNLSRHKRNYNYKLSATRVLIENAFGILKSRFRQLIRTDFFSVDVTSKFIISCCVLHNLCIDADDLWEEDNRHMEDGSIDCCDDETGNLRENVLHILGENKRNTICDYLNRVE